MIAGLFLIALAACGAFFGRNVMQNLVSLEADDSEEVEIEVPSAEESSAVTNQVEYNQNNQGNKRNCQLR